MRWIVFLVGLLVAVPAAAQPKLLQAHASAAPTYTGPGNVTSGAKGWWSCSRGYSAAYATGSNKACNIRRASDNVACDFLIASSGSLGNTTATCNSSTQGGISYATFVGTDTTCNASIVGTTMTLQVGACTTALHVNDVLTGAGLTNPVYISAIGTCGSNTATNTCTLSSTQGTIVTETITAQVAGFVTKAYDQSGASNCTGPCDVAQATAANQPQLLPLGLNGHPVMNFVGSVPQYLTKSSFTSLVQPYSYSVVAVLGNQAPNARLITGEVGTTEGIDYGTGTNGVFVYAPSNVSTTVTVNTAHAIQGVINNASSSIFIDSTQTTGTAGVNASATTQSIGAASNGGFAGTFTVGEAGIWPSDIANTLHSNESAYWGTP